GAEYAKLNGGLVGGDRVWEGKQWLAANIPGWTAYSLGEALYQSRYLSDSGRLFFNSSDALVPQDIDGNEDVYEYEPPGVGSCSETAATFSARTGGCVGLISSGVAQGESGFLDASENGGDVFFLTAERLVPQATESSLAVYDAHECTAAAPCLRTPAAAPPPCTTADACRAAPSPQPAIFGAPSSATYAGPGDVVSASSKPTTAAVTPRTRAQKLALALSACRRHSRVGKRRATCERQARRLYGFATSTRKRARRRAR
ncbi:MAG: hypothetical protein FWD42_08300, partial [Solirubrobacterales bacterium]|nr:hypothetical protein [Solirubrobacterales bacterium]